MEGEFPIPDLSCIKFLNGEDVRKALVEILAPIHKKIEEGKALSKDEIQHYNMALRTTITTQFNNVAIKISSKLEIQPDDPPEVKKVKGLAGLTIHNYLSTVANWLANKVEYAFKSIVQGVQSVYAKLKSAIQKIYDVWFN